MTTKLHQKLIEDIRLQKRLLGLIDNQDIVPNERPLQETNHKRSSHLRSNNIFRDDDGEKANMSGDRRNSSWRRSVAKEACGSRHELVAYETRTSSKPLKPLQDFPMYCHYNDIAEYNRQQQEEEQQTQKVNSINKRSAAASTGIAGTRHRNSERRADDGRGPGAFSNSMQIYHVAPHITRKSQEKRGHHHHRRSLDLGEVNRQCLSDSDAHVQSNAQTRSYLQLREISRDAHKLGNIVIAAKDGRDARRDLLKGAMDLEESLRILSKLQKATGSLKPVERPRQSVDLKELLPYSHRVLHKEPPRHSFDGRREPPRHSFDGRREPPRLSFDGRRELGQSTTFDLREAIRSSLDRQKMLYSKNGDGGTEKNHIRSPESIAGANAGMQLVENKKRIPNVIARLMGLDEIPSDSHPKSQPNSSSGVPSRVVGRTNSQMRRRTIEEEDAAALRGLKPERARPQQSMPRPSFVQSRKPAQDSGGGGQQAGVHIKGEDYHDTIQAALKQIKQQPPTKPSFHEELSQKLKRLHSVDDQNSDQEPKTLKQILETMQIKGILHSNPDQVKQKADDAHMHEPVKILKPVTDMPKLAAKAQEHREPVKILKPVTNMAKPAVKEQEHSDQPFQAGNPLPEKVLSMVRNPKPSNKVVAKEAPSQPSIVVIKPVTTGAVQQPQTSAKANDLHPKSTASSRNKQGNLGKKTELEKKKLPNSELGRSEGDGKSKKKKNANGSQAKVKRLQQKTRCSNDGLQKHSKSQQSPPPQSPPVLQDLKSRRSERISKKNNDKVSSPPTSKTEKQRSAQDRNTHSKAKGSASRPRSSLSPHATDQISSDVWQTDKQNAQRSIEIPEPAINQNGQRIDSEDNNDDKKSGLGPNIEWTPECPNVESLHPPSEESSDGESSSATTQQFNNTQELIAISEISVVSVLELQQEADPPDEEDETADSDDENEEDEEEEDQEEDLSSLPTCLQDSDEKGDRFPAAPDDKTERFGVSNDNLLNYANEEESTAPEFDDCETDYRDNLWQLLAKDRTLIDAEAAEPTEPYSRLYHKLQEIEEASYSSHDGGKQEHAIDDLERRLVLDCVKELLKRKARLRLQMKQPFALSRRRRASLGLSRRNSIQELVQELSSDVEELRAYQQAGPCDDVRNDKLGSDFVYTVLKKDLDMGNGCVNSIWNPSWDNGLYGEEEAQEIGRDVENLVFDELVEETILDYVLV